MIPTMEYFDYNQKHRQSLMILVVLIILCVICYAACMYGLIHLYQRHLIITFWILFIVACLPLLINHVLLALALVIIGLICMARRWTLSARHIPYIALTLFTAIYWASCYVMITSALFIMTNMTYFDIRNPHVYRIPLLTTEHIKRYFAFENEARFTASVARGRQVIRTQTVVFSLLARNISYNLPALIVKLESIGSHFHDYRVIIFENDSVDDSRERIKAWVQSNRRVELLDCCHFGSCDCRLKKGDLRAIGMRSYTRVNTLKQYRQALLHQAQTKYGHFDYYIITDSDISGGIYLDGFLSTFAHDNDEWDAVFANGVTTVPFLHNSLLPYDGFAFIGSDQDYDYTATDLEEFRNQSKHLRTGRIVDAQWIQCKSGFNGMSIFKMASIRSASYMNGARTFKCEHIDLFFNMHHEHHKDRVFYNPALILFSGHQGKS